MKTVTITWRNEAYGQLSGIASAFRLYDCGDFSDAAVKRIHGKARKAGYVWSDSRCAWTSYDRTAAAKFAAALQDLGYQVKHAGASDRTPGGDQ